MAQKILDSDNLDELFNLENNEELSENDEIKENKDEKIIPITSLEKELSELIKNSNDILLSAKYLIETSPDAETIQSSAQMVKAMTDLIAEARAPFILTKKLENMKELEKLKAKNKLTLEKAKSKYKLLNLGKGNTFNIQNNNVIPFSQEQVIKDILIQERNINPTDIIDI